MINRAGAVLRRLLDRLRVNGSPRGESHQDSVWRRWSREGELAAPPALVPAADYLRIIAAIGLVYYHALGEPGKYVGSTSLGVFLLLSFQQLAQPVSLKVFITRRSLRLVLPWLGWWVIYAAARAWIEHGFSGLRSASSLLAVMDWPASHLWYLPFILVATATMLAIRPLVRRVPLGWRWAVGGVVGLTLMTMVPLAPLLLPTKPILIYAIPSVGFGLAYSYALRYRGPGRLRRFLAVSAVMAVAAVIAWTEGLTGEVALAYLLGGIIILPCALTVKRSPRITRLSVLTLGVYLAHPLCFRIADKLGAMVGLKMGLPGYLLAGTVGAALLTYFMRRIPYLRALV